VFIGDVSMLLLLAKESLAKIEALEAALADHPSVASKEVSPAAVRDLDEALGKVVRCTDGELRMLTRYDEKLGYYSVPIKGRTWMSLSGTYIAACRKLFIGGEIVEDEEVDRIA
jgi:hypothetical protein